MAMGRQRTPFSEGANYSYFPFGKVVKFFDQLLFLRSINLKDVSPKKQVFPKNYILFNE